MTEIRIVEDLTEWIAVEEDGTVNFHDWGSRSTTRALLTSEEFANLLRLLRRAMLTKEFLDDCEDGFICDDEAVQKSKEELEQIKEEIHTLIEKVIERY